MEAARLGAVLRAIRIRKRLRQQDVASIAGLSRSAISRLEHGHLEGTTLRDILAAAGALGIRVDLVARWHGGDLDRLINSRHSGMHETVARWFASRPDWMIAPEVSFAIYGERGVIDILAWHAATRSLLVIELKTEIVDVNDLMGSVDRKRRLATAIAKERGWDPRTVSVLVLVAEGRTNRRRVQAHAATLRAAFPHDGRQLRAWLRSPQGVLTALAFLPDARAVGATRDMATVRRVRRSREAADAA